ncbi:MAG: phenylalanine--tRNA ligase subunit beta, partial [Pseudomonadota bacterium]|nr:phenylalanine--tRNA ligase subunit beta [Pseudomonadota bacterium]
MKFTLSWLKDHLETEATLDEIVAKLTSIGLEVDGVEDPSEKFAPFKVAYVESAEQHPDADRLRVLMVNTGKETLQVVCGAPNAKAGMKGIFAPVGSYVPGIDIELKKGNIRGQESNGMMVSEREMGLSDEHDGIIELEGDPDIGTPFAKLFGMDDPVIEIGLTPNRADCAGVRGIARDLAAAGMGTLKPLKTKAVKGSFDSPIGVEFAFSKDDADACPLFLGRYVKNVKNGPSPEWLQNRLTAIGLRPISALVDITNYVSYDLCRPLHVFDADKVSGNLTVRLGKKGETLDALDEKTYEIPDFTTVIADDKAPLALGGIMGGMDSGCTDETANVFLEVAYFDPARTAKSGRALQIVSDARYRFERGVDPAFLPEATEIATQMILDLCGGEASNVVSTGVEPEWKRSIEYNPEDVDNLIGLHVPEKEQRHILSVLGFELESHTATPPSWRGDVEGRADLVEEIIRIHGFDNIPAISVRNDQAVAHSAETPTLSKARRARNTLAERGLNECVTWSFMAAKNAELFGANDEDTIKALTLLNPINAELDQMRPSILPNLIEAAGRNRDKGY